MLQKQLERIVLSNAVRAESDHAAAKTTLEIVDDSPPFSSDKEALNKAQHIERLIEKAEGRLAAAGPSGGTSDCNNLSRPGLSIIDGLGAKGGGMHTEKEFIILSSLKTRAAVLAEFLSAL